MYDFDYFNIDIVRKMPKILSKSRQDLKNFSIMFSTIGAILVAVGTASATIGGIVDKKGK